MKIYINKYKDHWISPYTMLDYIFFWKDWSKCSRTWKIKDSVDDVDNIEKGEKSRFIERPDWVDTWSDRLVPISMSIQWVWDKIDPKIDYVKIDKWDTWSMDHTLSKIILPMLKQLKDTKHGSPCVDDEDVPDELKSTSAPPKESEHDVDGNHFQRWDYVLDEMIFAFEHKLDDSWKDKFYEGTTDYITVFVDKDGNEVPKGEHVFYRIKHGPNHTFKCDHAALEAVQKRISNGFRLFGKYYEGLWD